MKPLALIAAILTTTSTAPAQADTWTWVSISSGSTLDAHLARCHFARPNPLTVFSLLARLQSRPSS